MTETELKALLVIIEALVNGKNLKEVQSAVILKINGKEVK